MQKKSYNRTKATTNHKKTKTKKNTTCDCVTRCHQCDGDWADSSVNIADEELYYSRSVQQRYNKGQRKRFD